MTTPEPTAAPVPASAPAPVAKTNTLAIVSLILGIVGFNIIAVICGHIALSQIKKTGESGKPLAIIGLVLGYIAIVTIVIIIIATVVFASAGAIVVTTN